MSCISHLETQRSGAAAPQPATTPGLGSSQLRQGSQLILTADMLSYSASQCMYKAPAIGHEDKLGPAEIISRCSLPAPVNPQPLSTPALGDSRLSKYKCTKAQNYSHHSPWPLRAHQMPIPASAEASATKSVHDTNLREPQNILQPTSYTVQKPHCDLEYYLAALSALSPKPWHSVLTGSLATDFKFQELNEFLISPHKTSRPCRLLSLFLRKGKRVQGKKPTQRQESNKQRPFPSSSSSESLHTNTARNSWPVPGTPAHVSAASSRSLQTSPKAHHSALQ